jgi:hypothetical protein
MYVARYVMSRIFVFWLSVAILVYGWFNHAKLVNDGFRASGTLVKGLTKVDQTGKAETLMAANVRACRLAGAISRQYVSASLAHVTAQANGWPATRHRDARLPASERRGRRPSGGGWQQGDERADQGEA